MSEKDQATMFTLAGIAICAYSHTRKGDVERAAKVMRMIPPVISKNPGFLERFQEHQRAILEDLEQG